MLKCKKKKKLVHSLSHRHNCVKFITFLLAQKLKNLANLYESGGIPLLSQSQLWLKSQEIVF